MGTWMQLHCSKAETQQPALALAFKKTKSYEGQGVMVRVERSFSGSYTGNDVRRTLCFSFCLFHMRGNIFRMATFAALQQRRADGEKKEGGEERRGDTIWHTKRQRTCTGP